ncbi:MAG: sulfatase-like hydrolase/transferase [Acidobacteria bacterium]|nr:sulfatase-like hydrolase/transferase [Acidobacteriota bacterium]
MVRRRDFLSVPAALAASPAAAQAQRPNILWITCEDMSPTLGCYGDTYAVSPNLDRLAQRSLRYLHVWSNAPVCAPARTSIISGMYPPSTGSEHMRSLTRLAPGQKMFPQILRENGYYTSNNAKEDYNLEHTGKVWDESSNKAHWRNRAAGQPFFSVFNFLITHESQVRRRPHTLVHDPAKVRIPAYHPDAPEVRHDWAQYYDNITEMDKMAARALSELEQDRLAQDTIVFFYSDHGAGMPRSKRWPYDSGLHVPLLVHIPEKFRRLAPREYRAGGTTDRLVSFVDLAPTALSLAGIRKTGYHQGHSFLGSFAEPEQPYVYGFRGRMDERYDMVRSVRDKRYVYVRNYMPHRIYGQHIAYLFEMPTARKWQELYKAGKLGEAQRKFWEAKPPEELYDLQTDRDEVNNLAGSAGHRKILERMRKAQQDLARKIRDTGFLPENEIHARSKGSTPYEMGHDPARYPAERVMAMAETATSLPRNTDVLLKGLLDPDSAVRYWAAVGLLMAGRADALEAALRDPAPAVRIVAAEAQQHVETLLELSDQNKHGLYTAMQALNSLEMVGAKAKGFEARIRSLPRTSDSVDPRMRANPGNLIDRILENLKAAS